MSPDVGDNPKSWHVTRLAFDGWAGAATKTCGILVKAFNVAAGVSVSTKFGQFTVIVYIVIADMESSKCTADAPFSAVVWASMLLHIVLPLADF